MITEVTMPSMGADMTEGTIVKWLKKEGDEVKRGDKLAEIETDKTVVEMESYGEGILKKIVVPEGQVVPVGDLIAYVGGEGDEIPDSAAPSSVEAASKSTDAPQKNESPSVSQDKVAGARVKASPIAKKLAVELGVDISTVSGTGPGGRITREDVEAAAEGGGSTESEQPSGNSKTIPLTSMRKAIAGVVSKSKTEIPHFYISNSADMTAVIKARSEFNKSKGLKVSVNDVVIYAVTQSLKKFPKFNSSFSEGNLIENQSINIGMAIALPEGLIVPAVLGCESKNLEEISNSAKDLATRAKGEGDPLTQEENSGGTFSVSNLGMFDIDQFTAIIVPPQSAILSVGKAREEAVVDNGEIKVSQQMKMTLSVDHRVNDGAEAAMFLGELKSILESPNKIFG
ncbi:MAG: dihydrolipoamide acetyltransferase [Chloroflexi bacterium]|nr:dihydrolipoamide acetyltransferase [Chloroflexota bacterium]|tara:strand:- start:7467 stop:8663 length:1197 start_codon:yes stop_codon:yes gene_type:complete